ncbi:MAG: hypothetical protein M0Z51_11170 [Propionibacterium sp.]|nr:hypothetical protein [Propionibacterium sp.]
MGPQKRRRGLSFGPSFEESRAQAAANPKGLPSDHKAPELRAGGISTGTPSVDYSLPSSWRITSPAPSAAVGMGEFDAPEFSIEPVTGTRSFEVDKLGRLTGVTYRTVWTPGENKHQCHVADTDFSGMISAFSAYIYGDPAPTAVSSAPKPSSKPAHNLPGCKCGFYGYYDGSDDYGKPARVSGVIEGYGEVVIGTRGFRATKARIVALTIEADVPPHLAAKVRHNYADIPFYESFAQMVAAHPCDCTQGVTPESDPEFWTRSI